MSKNKLKHFQDLDNFIIFGAGEASHPVRSYLEKIGKRIIAYSDNNSNLHGSFINNTLVIAPEAIRKYFSKGTGIIIACSSQEKIAKQLVESLGFSLRLVFPYITEMFAPQFGELAYQEIASHVEQTCGLMNDPESIKYIDSLVKYRRYLNPLKLIPNPKVLGFYNYKTPIPMIKNGDTIIDCGAYTGDTAQEFLSRADIKEIIAVEGMTINFSKLKELSSSLNGKRIRPINVFLSEKEEIVSVPQLHDQSDIDPRYKIKTKTNYKNENAVPLDSLIQNDKVDLIKIDVEGADLSVLKGATRIILKDKPSLIVSSYHENNHIWQVPETIQKLESKYKIYAGHHHKCVYEIEYYAVI